MKLMEAVKSTSKRLRSVGNPLLSYFGVKILSAIVSNVFVPTMSKKNYLPFPWKFQLHSN